MQKWKKEYQQFKITTEEYLKATVEEMLYQSIPKLCMEKFAQFQKTGNRLLYEQEYFAKRKFLTIFGVAALWMKHNNMVSWGECTATEVYHKLEEILLSVCEEVCWALPAHVDRGGNPDWRNTIDLFAAETAQALMDVIDATGDNLRVECVLKVREQVQKRILEPFFRSKPGAYGWENCNNNWNAVCNGCIGSAYLHSLANGEEANMQYLQRICGNLKHYIGGFAEDGTCMEGLGYYFYGMVYFVNFAQELLAFSNGQRDLLCDDKLMLISKWWSKCYFEEGLTVCFSDGSNREKYRVGLGCILAERFRDLQIPPVSLAATLEDDPCYRYLPLKQDVFSTFTCQNTLCMQKESDNIEETPVERSLEASSPLQARYKTHILPAAQWCIAQAKMPDNTGKIKSIGFACKGGHNGESHNHNDVGSFFYLAGEELFLTDLGAGEYTKEYFNAGRYNILCNRSLGHNVPLIAGKEQVTGAEYGCKMFRAEEDEGYVHVFMSLEGAYGETALSGFQRNFAFEVESGACTVTDDFESNKRIIVTENLVTQISPQIKDNEVWLEGQDRSCRIQIKPTQTPRIITEEHSNHQGEMEQVYLIQWDVFIENKVQVEIHISV